MSDIVLTDDQTVTLTGQTVEMDAPVLHLKTRDIILDSPDRRRGDHTHQPRRALVHDETDGLTINFANDYPGGVTISGEISVEVPTIQVIDPPKGSPLANAGLAGTLVKGDSVAETLGDTIWSLRTQLQELEAKVAALQAKQ